MEESNDNFRLENVKECYELLLHKKKVNPHVYIGRRSDTIKDINYTFNSQIYSVVSIPGGNRLWSKRARQKFDGTERIVLFFASLAEFHQVLSEDETTSRMTESLREYEETITSNHNSRVVLILTKPDILIRKLRMGLKYDRQFHQYVRPELQHVSNEKNLDIIVNSMVEEYFQIFERQKSRSRCINFEYHIINVVSTNDVQEIMPIILNQLHQHYISPSLLNYHVFFTKMKLHCEGNYPFLFDISLTCQ